MGFEPRLIEFSLVTKYCCSFNIPGIGNVTTETDLKGSDEWIKIENYHYDYTKSAYVLEYHYGGNQSWMNDNKFTSKPDKNLEDGGCGIITGCDVITYLSMKNSNNLPHNISGIDIFNKGIHDNTVIGKTEYTDYATYMGNNNFKLT